MLFDTFSLPSPFFGIFWFYLFVLSNCGNFILKSSIKMEWILFGLPNYWLPLFGSRDFIAFYVWEIEKSTTNKVSYNQYHKHHTIKSSIECIWQWPTQTEKSNRSREGQKKRKKGFKKKKEKGKIDTNIAIHRNWGKNKDRIIWCNATNFSECLGRKRKQIILTLPVSIPFLKHSMAVGMVWWSEC